MVAAYKGHKLDGAVMELRFLGSGSGLTPEGVARKVALWLDRADHIEIRREGP